MHGATTTAATGLKPGDPGFKEARYAIGKRTNFAKNYGAQYKKIRQMYPNKTEEECHKIDDAYYTAFPGVKEYHNYWFHIKGFFIGEGLALFVCAMAGLVVQIGSLLI